MKSIRVLAAMKVPNVFGGFYKSGELIKEINPKNVKRIVQDGRRGDVIFYYNNGLHEVYNQNAVTVEIEV